MSGEQELEKESIRDVSLGMYLFADVDSSRPSDIAPDMSVPGCQSPPGQPGLRLKCHSDVALVATFSECLYSIEKGGSGLKALG